MNGPSLKVAKNTTPAIASAPGEVDLFIDASGNIKTIDEDGVEKNYGASVGANGSDHGALTGLSDDDHTQYHNDSRGDARYFTQAQVTSQLAGKSNVGHTHVASDITDFNSSVNANVDTRVGADIAPLVAGKVPAANLPAYVDDVLEFANLASFPGLGEVGKIYVALDTNKQYRWSGSAYIELVSSPGTTDNVPEGSLNQYFTNTRAQSANAVAIAAKQDRTADLTPIVSLLDSSEIAIGNSSKIGRGLFGKPNVERWNWFSADFIQSFLGDLTSSAAGTGASTQAGSYGINLTENCQGVAQSDTGTTATGRAALGSPIANHMFNRTGNKWYFGARLAVEALSVAGVEQFTMRAGFGNNHTTTLDGTNGAFFRYTDGVNGGRFECVSIKAGVSSAFDSGVLVDVNYHVLEIEMNEAEIKFFIDGNLVHTETSATVIPSLPTETFGFGWKIEKNIGVTQRNMSADWYYLGSVANFNR